MRSIFQFSVCLLLGLTSCSSRDENLDARVRAETKPFKGRVSIYAKNLETGATYSLNGDDRVPTASTIKLAIMVEVFARVAEGRAKWSDQIVCPSPAGLDASGRAREEQGILAICICRLPSIPHIGRQQDEMKK